MRLLHTEKRWDGIPASPITADGLENGIITVEDTAYYKTKMNIIMKSDTNQPTRYQIQRVLSRTQMIIGLTYQDYQERRKKQKNTLRIVDASQWLVADNATIEAPEQERSNIPHEDYERAVYEEEPVMAKRVIPVNEYGQVNSPDNPLYTQLSDGEFNIGTVNADLDVQLTHLDNYPDSGDEHDSIRVGDGVNELQITNKRNARVVDTLHCGGVNKIVTLTGNVQEIKVGTTAKSDRKTVFIRPLTGKIRWGFQNNITDDDSSTGGDPLFKRQPAEITAEANTPVYMIGDAGIKVFIGEA